MFCNPVVHGEIKAVTWFSPLSENPFFHLIPVMQRLASGTEVFQISNSVFHTEQHVAYDTQPLYLEFGTKFNSKLREQLPFYPGKKIKC